VDEQEPNDHGAAPAEPLDFDTWAAPCAALLDLDEGLRLALLAEVGIAPDDWTRTDHHHGEPHVRGTDIPVSVVLNELVVQKDFQGVVACHPGLSEDDVGACVAWAAATCSHAAAAPRDRFDALVAEWRRETGGWSNPHKIVAHRCYRDIVAMGWEAVPFILADLERNADADFWGPALREITGETAKIASSDAGRVRAPPWTPRRPRGRAHGV
jgi:uncharacterized protein (DUF433 family)